MKDRGRVTKSNRQSRSLRSSEQRQKKADSALRSSVQELFVEGTWLRSILDSLSDGIIATDSQSSVRYVNPVAARWTGWPQSEAVGKSIKEIYDLRTMAGQPVEQFQIHKAIAAAAPAGKERFLLRSRDGQIMPIEDAAAPIVVEREVEGAVAIVVDITERIRRETLQEAEHDRLEEEISQAANELGETREQLRALSARLMTAHEQERSRLSRELHDDFGQRLAILSIRADRALQRMQEDPQETKDLLQSISEEAALLNNGLREMSHKLHPSVIEDLGLIAALQSLAAGFGEDGVDVSLWLAKTIPEVTLDTATALYRIAQEALRNAQKHAGGAEIQITLTIQDSDLELTIRDTGPGFDLASARLAGGLGLLSMQERARLVNGTLHVNSRPGQGTVIAVHVPL